MAAPGAPDPATHDAAGDAQLPVAPLPADGDHVAMDVVRSPAQLSQQDQRSHDALGGHKRPWQKGVEEPPAQHHVRMKVAEWLEVLGTGKAQFEIMNQCNGIWLVDGAEIILLSSLVRAVATEWNLNSVQRGLVVGVVYLGVLLGNLLSGSVGDSIGRRSAVLVSYFLVLFCSVLSTLAWDFYSLSVIRCGVGIGFGIGQPSGMTLSAEMVPSSLRLHNSLASGMRVGEARAVLQWARETNFHWRKAGSVFHGRTVDARKIEEKHGLYPDEFAPEVVLDAARDLPPTSAWRLPIEFPDQAAKGAGDDRSTSVFLMYSTYMCNVVYYGGMYAFPQVLVSMGDTLTISAGYSLLIACMWEAVGTLVAFFVGMYVPRKKAILIWLAAGFVSISMFALALPEGQMKHSGGGEPSMLARRLEPEVAGGGEQEERSEPIPLTFSGSGGREMFHLGHQARALDVGVGDAQRRSRREGTMQADEQAEEAEKKSKSINNGEENNSSGDDASTSQDTSEDRTPPSNATDNIVVRATRAGPALEVLEPLRVALDLSAEMSAPLFPGTERSPAAFFSMLLVFLGINLILLIVLPLHETAGKPLVDEDDDEEEQGGMVFH
eukprot:g8287.t1